MQKPFPPDAKEVESRRPQCVMPSSDPLSISARCAISVSQRHYTQGFAALIASAPSNISIADVSGFERPDRGIASHSITAALHTVPENGLNHLGNNPALMRRSGRPITCTVSQKGVSDDSSSFQRSSRGRSPACERNRSSEAKGDAVTIALTRAGVPVGFAVADRLRILLDSIIVRSIDVPWQPELRWER